MRFFEGKRLIGAGESGWGRGAFTLVELLISVVVVAIMSTAVAALLFGAMNSNRYVQSNGDAQSQLELGMRRMINNLHEAQGGSITLGTSTLSLITQPDSADGYPTGATVSYALQSSTTVTGQKDLAETDQRYGTNVLVRNVTTFTIAAVSGVADLYQVDLVVGTSPKEERHFKVFARN